MKHKTFEFLLCFRAWGESRLNIHKKRPLTFLGGSKKQQKPKDAHKHFPACPADQAQQVKRGQAEPAPTPLGWPSLSCILRHSTQLSATSGFPAAKQALQHLIKLLRTTQTVRNCARLSAEALLAPSIRSEHQGFGSNAFPFNIDCARFSNWITVHSAVSANPVRAVIKGVSNSLVLP